MTTTIRTVEEFQQVWSDEDFEFTIDRLIKCGAGDRATAIRWLHAVEPWLPYGYFHRECKKH